MTLTQTPARLGRFVLVMFPPQVYVSYGVLWCLALEGSVAVLADQPWRPSAATAARVLSVVLTLLFMRMVDEQKDLDYDRVHHPGRPLVTGAITADELRVAMAAVVLVVLALNAPLGWLPALLVLLPLGWTLLLAVLERAWPLVERSLLVNLLVAVPGQLLVIAYLYGCVTVTTPARPGWAAVPLALILTGVFLHFELARKTSWRRAPAERLYSEELGPVGAAAATLGVAVGAAVLAALLFRPSTAVGLLPVATVLLALVGGWRFLLDRRGDWPLLYPVLFVLGSYLALIVQAVALG